MASGTSRGAVAALLNASGPGYPTVAGSAPLNGVRGSQDIETSLC